MSVGELTGNPFRFNIAEFSGSLADLGVMLPLVLAIISLNGMDATAAFVGIGLAYILTALVYRLPIPVQPLKSVSALVLALGLPPVMIVSGAIWNTVAFLGMGLAGVDRWVQLIFPKPVVRGIQVGLAYLLAKLAWKLAFSPGLGWEGGFQLSNGLLVTWSTLLISGALVSLFLLLKFQPELAALGMIAFGVGVSSLFHGIPALDLHLTFPKLLPLIPDWGQLWQGLWLLALPQIPLSLGNSVYATADAARQYFGQRADHVTERKLMLTIGINDLVAAGLGGMPVCHGCGGLTAHYRLGARSGAAPLMIGTIFLGLGLLGGQASMTILGTIPFPVLGTMMAYVGWQQLALARDLRGWRDISTALIVLGLTILTGNMGIAFIASAVYFHLWNWSQKRFSLQAI